MRSNEMKMHVNIVAWGNILIGIPMVLLAGIVGFAISVLVLVVPITLPFFGAIGAFVFFCIAGYSLLGVIAGFSLMKYEGWARAVMILVSILHLINATTFGITTVLGLYSLFILLAPATGELFERGG